MRHPTRNMAPVRWVAIVLVSYLSGGTGLAVSPFDVDLGDGQVGELQVVDEELSPQLDAEAAYTIRYTRWRPASTNNARLAGAGMKAIASGSSSPSEV